PEGPFLRDIVETPDEDAPRLIFADWLEDHGQPERAELIRVQCELARPSTSTPRQDELRAREKKLVKAHGQRWLGPLIDRVKNWRFQRGLAHVEMGLGKFLTRKVHQHL